MICTSYLAYSQVWLNLPWDCSDLFTSSYGRPLWLQVKVRKKKHYLLPGSSTKERTYFPKKAFQKETD
jgi:hypothetical protein